MKLCHLFCMRYYLAQHCLIATFMGNKCSTVKAIQGKGGGQVNLYLSNEIAGTNGLGEE